MKVNLHLFENYSFFNLSISPFSCMLQVNKFTVCFCLYFLNAVTQGIKILDPTGANWIYFRYDVDATSYYLGQGFIGNYSIGKCGKKRKSMITK